MDFEVDGDEFEAAAAAGVPSPPPPERTQSAFRWLAQRVLWTDYATIAAMWLFAGLTELLRPFNRPIDSSVLADVNLAHPHLADIVPAWSVPVIALAGPIVVAGVLVHIVPFNRTLRSGSARIPKSLLASRKLHRFILGICAATALTYASTNLLKTSVGRFRPDFLSRCAWNATLMACTGDAALVQQGRVSFPSGHSSFSFCGLGFLSIWILRGCGWGIRRRAGKDFVYTSVAFPESMDSLESRAPDIEMGGGDGVAEGSASYGALLDSVGLKKRYDYSWVHSTGSSISRAGWTLPVLGALVPLWIASYIAVTRLQQFVHHPTDVLFGSLMGFSFAVFIHWHLYL
ncbi:hypothetical protein HDU82_002267 [Entophlyctis luteolus]|nr:hypothetical protein HDU82_002267 [Entophlyctis luteolus]